MCIKNYEKIWNFRNVEKFRNLLQQHWKDRNIITALDVSTYTFFTVCHWRHQFYLASWIKDKLLYVKIILIICYHSTRFWIGVANRWRWERFTSYWLTKALLHKDLSASSIYAHVLKDFTLSIDGTYSE